MDAEFIPKSPPEIMAQQAANYAAALENMNKVFYRGYGGMGFNVADIY